MSSSQSPQQKTDELSSHKRPNTANVAVRFIPVAVSETQRTNHSGRTLCKVVGCMKVDFSYTNGFCKQHFALFSHGATVHRGLDSVAAEPWTCDCGNIVLATKKRCGSCCKWRGGSKGPVKSGGGAVGDGVFPKPKKPRVNKPIKLPDALSLPKLPKRRKAGRSRNALETESNKGSDQSLSFEEDIAKVRTAKDCAQRWSMLLMARDQRKPLNITNHNNKETDPFDCSDLIVSPTAEIVEQEVSKAVQRWKDLNSRLVLEEEEASCNEDTSYLRDNPLIVDGTMAGDGRRQRLLPPNFDYKCERMPNDKSADTDTGDAGQQQQNYYRPKVISLIDPTQTLDYESELWQVFHSMPKASDLEKKYGLPENAGTGNNKDGPHGCLHTLQVKKELKMLLSKHTRMDEHALGRLRVRDRHAIPMSLAATHLNKRVLHPNNILAETDASIGTSIRFEVLRHSVNLKRGSGRDANRLEVELSGSHHTLLDLHRVLVECACTADGMSSAKVNDSGSDVPAGVFFIENNLYTYGLAGEEAGRAIIEWLDGKPYNDPAHTGGEMEVSVAPSYRRKHLCISSMNATMPMSEAYMENLPLRIGIRYVHMIIDHSSAQSGNESAVFVTDIHSHASTFPNGQGSHDQLISLAPIIHDTWTPLKPASFCSACNSAVASIVTINDKLTDLSSTITSASFAGKTSSSSAEFQGVPLCVSCFRDLHYRAASNGKGVVLREGSAHQTHKAFAIDHYNSLTFAKANEKTPEGAMF